MIDRLQQLDDDEAFEAWWESQPPGMKNPASKSACRRGWGAALTEDARQKDDRIARLVAGHASAIGADMVVVPRSLAERSEAMFRSVDPWGSIAQEWKLALADRGGDHDS